MAISKLVIDGVELHNHPRYRWMSERELMAMAGSHPWQIVRNSCNYELEMREDIRRTHGEDAWPRTWPMLEARWDHEQNYYLCATLSIYSCDGMDWRDADGQPVCDKLFRVISMRLIGGPDSGYLVYA